MRLFVRWERDRFSSNSSSMSGEDGRKRIKSYNIATMMLMMAKNFRHSNKLLYPLVESNANLSHLFFCPLFHIFLQFFFSLLCCYILLILLFSVVSEHRAASSEHITLHAFKMLFLFFALLPVFGWLRTALQIVKNASARARLVSFCGCSYFESFIIFVWVIFVSYFTARVVFWVRVGVNVWMWMRVLASQRKANKKNSFVQSKDVVNSYIVTIITVLFSDGRIFAQSKNFFDRINFAYSSKVNRDDRA